MSAEDEKMSEASIVEEFARVLGKMLIEIAGELPREDLEYWGENQKELRLVLRSAAHIGERYASARRATPVSGFNIEIPELPNPTLEEVRGDWPFIVGIEDNHAFTDRRILTVSWSFDWCEFMEWDARNPAIMGAFGYQHLKYVFGRRGEDDVGRLFLSSYCRNRIVFPGLKAWDRHGIMYVPLLNCVDRIIQWRMVTNDTEPQWVAVG